MADNIRRGPVAPSTSDGFLADRLSFWATVTKFGTRVAIGIGVLLLLMWYFLV